MNSNVVRGTCTCIYYNATVCAAVLDQVQLRFFATTRFLEKNENFGPFFKFFLKKNLARESESLRKCVTK